MVISTRNITFFNATDEMMSIGVRTIRIISTSYSFGSICFIFSCFLQAIGKGVPSLTITMLRQLILLLPMAYILGRIYGLTGVWLAFPTCGSYNLYDFNLYV